MQWVLKDRRKVYDLLKASGIDVPRHVFMNRDGYISNSISGYSEDDLIEHDDHIEVNGIIINKPFVEKVIKQSISFEWFQMDSLTRSCFLLYLASRRRRSRCGNLLP
jgi:hypothetical protein